MKTFSPNRKYLIFIQVCLHKKMRGKKNIWKILYKYQKEEYWVIKRITFFLYAMCLMHHQSSPSRLVQKPDCPRHSYHTNSNQTQQNTTLPPTTVHNRAIPCQRSKKKGQRGKLNFYNEIWKIIRQIYDFGRFSNNVWNFGLFLTKYQKYQKLTVLTKWKLKKKKIVFY